MQALTITVSQCFDCQCVRFWSQILSYMSVKVTFILGSLISKQYKSATHRHTHINYLVQNSTHQVMRANFWDGLYCTASHNVLTDNPLKMLQQA